MCLLLQTSETVARIVQLHREHSPQIISFDWVAHSQIHSPRMVFNEISFFFCCSQWLVWATESIQSSSRLPSLLFSFIKYKYHRLFSTASCNHLYTCIYTKKWLCDYHLNSSSVEMKKRNRFKRRPFNGMIFCSPAIQPSQCGNIFYRGT